MKRMAAIASVKRKPRRVLVRQSVLFDKLFWRKAQARAWLKAHGYRYGDIDEKPNTYRFRQRDPNDFQKPMVTVTFMRGLKVVMGHLR